MEEGTTMQLLRLLNGGATRLVAAQRDNRMLEWTIEMPRMCGRFAVTLGSSIWALEALASTHSNPISV